MAHSTPAEQRRTSSPARGERREVITSRENKWLKVFRAALQGKGPQSDEPLGVEGLKMVEDALRSGLLVEALLFSESGGRDAEQVLRRGVDRAVVRFERTLGSKPLTVAGFDRVVDG